MSEPTSRACSEASLASGEPLVGTASDARFFAAVSGRRRSTSRQGGPVRGAAESSYASSPRAVGPEAAAAVSSAAARRRPGRSRLHDFSARTAQLRELPAERSAASIAAFLVARTSHSRRAPALRSPRAISAAASSGAARLELAPDARVDVAEVSHLGGHRLAANCLALPSGRLYGRVTAADLSGLVDAIRHDRAYLARYRGRSGLSELMQIAEAAALGRVLPGFRLDVAAPEPAGDSARLCVAGLELDFVRRRFSGIASCGDTEPELRERWVLQSVIEKER
jgi:hypothetical protein